MQFEFMIPPTSRHEHMLANGKAATDITSFIAVSDCSVTSLT